MVVLMAAVFCLGLAIGLWQADDPPPVGFRPAAVQTHGPDWYTPPDQDWAQVIA